jgi:hypothetical protein
MAQVPKDQRIPKEEWKAQERARLEAIVATMPEHMRFLEFTVENVMKVKFARIRPQGNVIVVGGRNGQGKSSALLSIGYLLCGAGLVPTDVIRIGEKTATITGELEKGWKITRYFDRRDPEQNKAGHLWATKVKLTGPLGETYDNPTDILAILLNDLTFDPMAFMRMKEKEQFEALKGMMHFDIDLDRLDKDQDADYEARKQAKYKVNDRVAQMKALGAAECATCGFDGIVKKEVCPECNGLGMVDTRPAGSAPAEAVDAAALAQRLSDAATWNATVAEQRKERTRLENLAAEALADAKAMREQATRLLEEALELDGLQAVVNAIDMQPQLSKRSRLLEEASTIVVEEEIDTAAVSLELQAALAANAAIERGNEYRKIESELRAAREAWKTIDDRMKLRAEDRETAMQTAGMPIEELAIGDGEVFYKGLPFNQASGAEQIRVSLAIGMASNPKLRILRFMDGGWDMLDDESQELVRQQIDMHGYQLWVEHVGAKGNVTVVMEEGRASGSDVVEG